MRNMKTTARMLIAAAVATATLAPMAASAQRYETSRAELRRDRQDVREERREYRAAVRNGDRRDVREERGEYRNARQEYREDRRDFRRERGNGRGHAAPHRGHVDRHHGPRFAAPFRYRPFNVGVSIGNAYWGPRYRVVPQRQWRLPPAGRNFTYVRHYDDLLLVNVRNGRVARVYRNFY